jgi:signal transduction histidine kinase
MKVRNKFILAFAPLLIIIVFFSIIGISTLSQIRRHISSLNQITPTAISVLGLKKVMLSLEDEINRRDIDRQKIKGQINKIQSLLRENLINEEQNGVRAIKTASDIRLRAVKVLSYARYILITREKGWSTEQINSVYDSVHKERLALQTILDQQIYQHLKDLEKTEKNTSAQYDRSIYLTQISLLVVILLTFSIIIYLTKTILTPIAILTEGSRQIGNGVRNYDLVLNSGDEFEDFANEFKAMARKLNESYQHLDDKVSRKTAELRQTNAELQKAESQVHLLSQELIRAQEVERNKISLDLHDNVAQELSALKMMSEAFFMEQRHDSKQLQQRMSEWAGVLKRCIGTVRELSYDLRPPALEQMGIKNALADYCREYAKKNNIQLSFNSAGMEAITPTLDYNVAINIYRLLQEALNNIKKHAQATAVKVNLVVSGFNLLLRIEDNGCGFDLDKIRGKIVKDKHLGILGMEERVKILHGSIEIISRPGEGTKILIEIPWSAAHVS